MRVPILFAEQALAAGDIGILVNNAGYYHHLDWHSATPKDWAETYDVNVLWAGCILIQRLVPAMVRRG